MKKLINILFGQKLKSQGDHNGVIKDPPNKHTTIVSKDKNIRIGDWCKLFSDNLAVHPEDRETWNNYPYKSEFHQCIQIDNGYYTVRFSGLTIRILEKGLIKTNKPKFYPYELINYVTTKGKLEIGRIIKYTGYYKPKPERAYTIIVNGKVKSNRYRESRLSKSSIPYNRLQFNEKLSKSVSYCLRHNPEEFGIRLDKNGWTDLDELIDSISSKEKDFEGISLYDISLMIDHSEKKRHELKPIKKDHKNYKWKIRAKYGHSISNKVNFGINEPPNILYHGTSSESIDSIMNNGLKPMTRQYVHLSSDIETARRVGLRKSKEITILKILSKEAFSNGQNFYKVDSNIWLTDKLNSKYVINEHDH